MLVGVDWVAEQRESTATPSWAPGTRYGHEPDAGAAPAAPAAGPDAPAGSAQSDAWVDVTDAPPSGQDRTDPV